MKRHILVALLCSFVHIATAHALQTLPDDKVDNASEVGAINSNFNYLNLGKLDLKPGDVIPRADSMYSLGSAAVQWQAVYTDTISATAAVFTGLSVSTFTCSSCTFTSARVVNALTGSTGDFSGALTAATVDTGQGANELYAMDQNVRTTDHIVAATVTSSGGWFKSNADTAFITVSSSSARAVGVGLGAGLILMREISVAGGVALVIYDFNNTPVIVGVTSGGTTFVTGAPTATQIQVGNNGVSGGITLLGGSSRNNVNVAYVILQAQ